MLNIKYFICFLFSNFYLVTGLFEYCDYQLNIDAGRSLFVNSPYYPNKYPSGSSCRYTISTPGNYVLDFQCNIQFDNLSNTCSTEFFYYNVAGDPNLPGSDYVCGFGSIHKQSTRNRLVISYTSSSQTAGGAFTCLVNSIPTTSVPSNCDCGWSRFRRVTGGIETGVNEFPVMAGVFDMTGLRIFCGATIIHQRYLLSAAHCYAGINPSNLAILVGDHDFTVVTDSPYTQQHRIIQVISHEQFRQNSLRNDIAILRTENDMTWSEGVRPACLPFNYANNDFSGTKVDAPGWGTATFGGAQSVRLLKVTLDVITNNNCRNQVSNLNSEQICTFTPGQDTCQYDSGGGLYYWLNRFYVIGIVSYGFGCATTTPSVNTRVTSYLQWIQSKTPEVQYCVL